ncbi:MAG: T9SS C-terminal target domain-containing protein, partial [Cytophagales bacterium]
ETFYEIERSTDNSPFTVFRTNIAPNTTQFLDNSLTKDITYFYRVRANINGVYMPYSNIQGCIFTETLPWVTALDEATTWKEQVQVFPNPNTTGIFQLRIPQGFVLQQTTVMALEGIVLEVIKNQNQETISLAHLSGGIYMLLMEDSKGRKCYRKIMKL